MLCNTGLVNLNKLQIFDIKIYLQFTMSTRLFKYKTINITFCFHF